MKISDTVYEGVPPKDTPISGDIDIEIDVNKMAMTIKQHNPNLDSTQNPQTIEINEKMYDIFIKKLYELNTKALTIS